MAFNDINANNIDVFHINRTRWSIAALGSSDIELCCLVFHMPFTLLSPTGNKKEP